jgi:deoxyuridine 5'-triphosphate nucleotidohydrolase
MTKLTGNETWTWGPDQQEAFDQIKKQICTELILLIPRREGIFKIEVDTSNYVKGAILYQEQDKVFKTIAYLSVAMSPTERNYDAADKELSAIITALTHWRHCLMGATEDFEIWTDHKNLTYFRSPQKLNRRQARWMQELSNYHFTLHHIPGEKNVKVDTLSRLAEYKKGEEDNKNLIHLKDHLFRGIKQEKEKLLVKRLKNNAKIPTKGSEFTAGHDIYSIEEKEIPSGGSPPISTGISITIPNGTYARIAPRSRLAVKNMIGVGAGVIDADYRGEVKVLLFNHRKQSFLVKDGDRIAQLLLEKIKNINTEEVEKLDETSRGGQGFGSSSIREVQMGNLDEEVRKAYKDFQVDTDIQGRMTKKRDEWYKDDNRILFFQEKMLVPDRKDLRERVISQNHDTPITSHAGINGTLKQISRDYWWPTIR